MISLQLRGRRQIAEPRKYCLVREIVFLWRVFSLIFVSHGLGIRFNSLQNRDAHIYISQSPLGSVQQIDNNLGYGGREVLQKTCVKREKRENP